MDIWRAQYLLPAIAKRASIALIGIGDSPQYWQSEQLSELQSHWDPARLAVSNAPYCVYDIDDTLVARALKRGINAKVCDVTTHPLSDTYDFIFASDVIEHVENPNLFFKHCAQSLRQDGKFIVTTPNALYWRNFFFPQAQEHPEHNCCFAKAHLLNLARKWNLHCHAIGSFQSRGSHTSIRQDAFLPIHWLCSALGRGNSLFACFEREHAMSNRDMEPLQ